jgi:hypothetical protein
MAAAPGDVLYLDLVARIHSALLPRTYVEIGIEFGTSLQLVLPGTQAIGIDPAPKIRTRLDPATRVFPMTSDAFFEQHDLRALLGDRPVDLGYIDGLHLFEFALRDFINLEQASAPDSVILIDDTYPPTAVSAARERTTNIWAGDVWKLVLCLRSHRPDLEVTTVGVAPTGVTIVRGLDPSSKTLSDSYGDLSSEYVDMSFSTIEKDEAAALNHIRPVWEQVRRLLPDRPYRTGDARLLRVRRALRKPTVANARYRTGQVLRHGPTRALVERVSGANRSTTKSPTGPS